MKFHVHRDGRGFGPYEESEARLLYAQGHIAAADLVWHEGMTQWQAAQQVFGAQPVVQQVHQSSPLQEQSVPPQLHWGLVLLFSLMTLGIFAWGWMFTQSSWVRKIDSRSNATTYLVAYLVLALVGAAMESSHAAGAQGFSLYLQLLSVVCFFSAYASMRRSMLNYYNSVEPIALKLSIGMTLLFNVLYLQHHMTRIARWKTGGVLRPQ